MYNHFFMDDIISMKILKYEIKVIYSLKITQNLMANCGKQENENSSQLFKGV